MFNPVYQITPKITQSLIKIELAKIKVGELPITPKILSSLRESAKLNTSHFSTKIEGKKCLIYC
jgi:hypothetical protein